MSYELEHRTTRRVLPGKHYPIGATQHGSGVNFAIYSQHAQEVYLLLFDDPEGDPTDVIRLVACTRRIWHCFVEGLRPGQLYGYKIRGPYEPKRGLRFNPHKLLVDPYARALVGKARNVDNLLLGYDPLSPAKDLVPDARDNTRIVPKSVIVDDAFDWQGDEPPDLPLEKLFIYEVHVKGFTAHKSSGVRDPGTYLGFVEKIPYLKALGVNAVELLPLHEFCVDDFLVDRGLTNYWGYNTLGFFAPESSFSTGARPGCQVAEFKTLVRELHKAGIEVILDVVYNHTSEGSELGPTLSLKGIDNTTYYLLTGGPYDAHRYYVNHTGCGNSLNLNNAQVIRYVMDSLRYWVEMMHVDGFRFDLASVLGREEGGVFDQTASFFDAIQQDPALSRIKLIAEPWDLGTYQVGNFPIDWSEWNGRFRDTMRKFAKGDGGQLCDLGYRLSGSADLYRDDGRSAFNSINFVTCHDGFTLWDLVSYNQKHNEANQEGNRDGTDDNQSWNCGVEGETDDPDVNRLRWQIAKNHMCHLLFSLGTPMLLGGDEFLRTQKGNNNAYCQDNEISWFDWDLCGRNADFVRFVRKAIAFNKRYTILHRRKFHAGLDTNADGVADISWFGSDLAAPSWQDAHLKTLCYQLDGAEEPSEVGDYLLFLMLNADHNLHCIQLPAPKPGMRWYRVVDTSLPLGPDFLEPGEEVALDPADHYLANPRSTVVLIAKRS
ncbi:MAG: glycogen debranching protein GlgX [Deltaproteobacteria bacterium]|nr:glycogen debranching protein GlgX [Deltaproteobacteria bacterium]